MCPTSGRQSRHGGCTARPDHAVTARSGCTEQLSACRTSAPHSLKSDMLPAGLPVSPVSSRHGTELVSVSSTLERPAFIPQVTQQLYKAHQNKQPFSHFKILLRGRSITAKLLEKYFCQGRDASGKKKAEHNTCAVRCAARLQLHAPFWAPVEGAADPCPANWASSSPEQSDHRAHPNPQPTATKALPARGIKHNGMRHKKLPK